MTHTISLPQTVKEPSNLAARLLTRRQFLLGAGSLIGMSALSACVLVQPAVAPPDSTVTPEAEAATTPEMRTITDGNGRTVEIPVNPQRVVAGYTTDADVAIILELPLVGAPGARGSANQAFARYQPQEKLANVERITTFVEPNLEQILALNPDVIIDSVGDYIEGRIDLFMQIAPTLDVSKEYSEGWRTYLRTVAQVFDRTELAEAFITDYEIRAAELGARIRERYPDATFALIGAYEPGVVWVSDLTMHPVKILVNDVGLTPSVIMPATIAERPNLSMEQLMMLGDTDMLFLRVEPLPEGEGRDQSIHGPLKESPLWQRLPAVQNGMLIEFDAELFYASPLTASAFLDTVEAALLT